MHARRSEDNTTSYSGVCLSALYIVKTKSRSLLLCLEVSLNDAHSKELDLLAKVPRLTDTEQIAQHVRRDVNVFGESDL